MKILLVSDAHHFATMGIYEGYLKAFEKLKKYQCKAFETHSHVHYLSKDISKACLLYTALRPAYGFTHVLFITGLSVDQETLQMLRIAGKKVGIISTEDPHSTSGLQYLIDNCDWYFTNEKTLHQTQKNMYYVPLAATPVIPDKANLPDKYKSDVCYVGTVYPNRVQPLEDLIDYCRENDKTLKICGVFSPDVKSEKLEDYMQIGIISQKEVMSYYSGAKLTVNLDRDPSWNARFNSYNPLLAKTDKDAESINPRAYDIAICKSAQLFVDPRQEAWDVFGKHILTAKGDNISEGLDKYFGMTKTKQEKMVDVAYTKVADNHLYMDRIEELMKIMTRESK